MGVGAISSGTLQNGGTIETSSQSGQLDMQDFFTLMAAQLQYQDPMNPTDDSQFMGEMAQFGSLEQLTNLSSSINYSLAAGMVGKTVSYSHYDDTSGETISGSGVVSAVNVNSTTPKCLVGGSWVSMSDIEQIAAGSDTKPTAAT
ncbi:MAG: flagellar hook capping FlgD N-terminal domain-containing protein [Clostridia bacterium]|nr:flagellar hook capping FlgD N-terminal domain-containing protein [Clostridia bacterium]MDR3643534.1 flagellar hook capping FlgD N-terminal domain-containing protein [Clostridia bacterium]